MKEQITQCYNLVAEMLNQDDDVMDRNKLNKVYEILTEMLIEL